MIEIPADQLAADTLTAIIEEFVAREGTDYGAVEVDFSDKVRQVQAQIARGEVIICFDPQTESCTLMALSELKAIHNK